MFHVNLTFPGVSSHRVFYYSRKSYRFGGYADSGLDMYDRVIVVCRKVTTH